MGWEKVSVSRWVGRRTEGAGGWVEGFIEKVGGMKVSRGMMGGKKVSICRWVGRRSEGTEG